ncbi:MAG: hypothetical protein ACOC8E_00195 [Planctomycetota bacterium]
MCPTRSFFRALAPTGGVHPEAPAGARGPRGCSSPHDEKRNARPDFAANDSSVRPGDMWVWRYQKEKE